MELLVYIEILTPFETATHCIQGDRVVTSSMIVPCTRLSYYEDCEAFLMASALNLIDINSQQISTPVENVEKIQNKHPSILMIRYSFILYLKNIYLHQACKPVYWKTHDKQFPCITKLVHVLLALSAPVERLFSVAGKVFCPKNVV